MYHHKGYESSEFLILIAEKRKVWEVFGIGTANCPQTF
jgi:hypothetical protein